MKVQKKEQEGKSVEGLISENSIKKVGRGVGVLGAIIMTVVSLTACDFSAFTDGEHKNNQERQDSQQSVLTENAEPAERVDTGFILAGPDSYDSADTPVVVDINKDDNTVTFLNLEIGRRYTLSMDGTTRLFDKYGESISLDQIEKGAIVDVTFLKSKKHLTTMQLSPQAWSYSNVERYEINRVQGEVTIGKEVYKLGENVQYLSDGRAIEEIDLHPADILTFWGIEKEILCIYVEKGHGYLRLANDENFIGGWIEIGQSLIQRITEDMLLTVPEGSYQVNISHNGNGGTKRVVINRNEEATLDIGDFKIAEPECGTILFSVTPSKAQLYIDGAEVDFSQPVSLEYGIHQLIARADGYQTITSYLRVGTESAGIDVVLDAVERDDEEDSDSEGSRNSSTEADTVTDYYKVYIDAPENVEVYLDGNYVGISPCSFRKTAGSHVITLRKTGYETRSYTVQIDEEDKDFSYSFVDLVATDYTSAEENQGSGAAENESAGTSRAAGPKFAGYGKTMVINMSTS